MPDKYWVGDVTKIRKSVHVLTSNSLGGNAGGDAAACRLATMTGRDEHQDGTNPTDLMGAEFPVK